MNRALQGWAFPDDREKVVVTNPATALPIAEIRCSTPEDVADYYACWNRV